jgi:hypothetical protein
MLVVPAVEVPPVARFSVRERHFRRPCRHSAEKALRYKISKTNFLETIPRIARRMASKIERILILAKTYPSPSAKHTETSCVAGVNDRGEMRRLYPVPFRMITENQQFQKWQWVTVRVEKSPGDHRPESHKVYVDTIEIGDKLPSDKGWAARRPWWEKMPEFDSFDALEQARQAQNLSLALLRPKRLEKLEITPVDCCGQVISDTTIGSRAAIFRS